MSCTELLGLNGKLELSVIYRVFYTVSAVTYDYDNIVRARFRCLRGGRRTHKIWKERTYT